MTTYEMTFRQDELDEDTVDGIFILLEDGKTAQCQIQAESKNDALVKFYDAGGCGVLSIVAI